MKQIIQDLSKGTVSIINSTPPQVHDGELLINTTFSLVSSGTERMLLNFGQASFLKKARLHPEKVSLVLEKIKTDGLFSTLEAVQSKLKQPIALGYSNVGVVEKIGAGVSAFKPGDRIVSNGPHADVVTVANNLCARIPDNVADESAAFAVVASIGLQGIRLIAPTLGESVVVIGTGLIGLLTIQLLKAHGCNVLAIDLDDSKLELAQRFGAMICNPAKGEDPIAKGSAFSRGYGVDAVIITAATKSNDPISQAARMSRKRGRIVLVGVTGLELNRSDFYEKELSFQVSCSYGPGRYDPAYEEKGLDYPIGFVRWTEQRNFEAVLNMMATGQLDVTPLITHRFAFEEAEHTYHVLANDPSALGILLEYPSAFKDRYPTTVYLDNKVDFLPGKPVIGFIGAGNYASRVLIPAFKQANAQLNTITTSGGINGVLHGKKCGFTKATTDVDVLLSDTIINTVCIVTRHNTHAQLVIKALKAGKHVFVEKPLAINIEELSEIESTFHLALMNNKPLHLMVGFNRRFSPLIKKMKSLLETVDEPKSFIMTINAGAIPADHWTQDVHVGGGRIIGEACHFIDLMRFLADCPITSVHACSLGESPSLPIREDKATITLGFADGSYGTIHYLANGARSFPKERVEVFTSGRVLQLDNFRKLKGYGWAGFKKMNLWYQDKGQKHCVTHFLNAIESASESPIPFDEIIEVSRITIEAAHMIRVPS